MKENKYDDEVFFDKYSQMSRSKEGLIAAGEWDTLKRMLPSFNGAIVLDLGCGYGWHCNYAVENGAEKVVGIDISSKMIKVAKEKTSSDKVSYQCVSMEDMDFENDTFDIAISSLAMHYIQDYKLVIKKIVKTLKKGGKFIFSCEHPIFTAQGSQDWEYDENGAIKYFPVDNYFVEGKRTACFLGEQVTKYHRTLTTYVGVLKECGLRVEEIVEPMPTQEAIDTIAHMADELRRPMMLIISAVKL